MANVLPSNKPCNTIKMKMVTLSAQATIPALPQPNPPDTLHPAAPDPIVIYLTALLGFCIRAQKGRQNISASAHPRAHFSFGRNTSSCHCLSTAHFSSDGQRHQKHPGAPRQQQTLNSPHSFFFRSLFIFPIYFCLVFIWSGGPS